MNIQPFTQTSRLIIQPLTLHDNAFIFELLNTSGWLKFIGDRNVHSSAEASVYIQKILNNKNINYQVVKLKESLQPVGVISFIKREHLEYHDIGFAFLPKFSNKGYAYEAANAVLHKLINESNYTEILAVTIPENASSVKLLKKLGFLFDKEITNEKETLHLYTLYITNNK